MVGDARLDRERLRAAVLHVVQSCEPDRLGAVKLHKVLFYSDMLNFIFSGEPMTGATYRKRPFGPTCDAALYAVDDLTRNGDIEVREIDYYGYRKKQYIARNEAETNRLSPEEKDILGKMIEFVCFDNSAKSISDFSHDLPWEMVEFGEPIPYHSAFHLVPNIVSPEAHDWAEAEGRALEDKGLGSEAPEDMAGQDARAIRVRMAEALGRTA